MTTKRVLPTDVCYARNTHEVVTCWLSTIAGMDKRVHTPNMMATMRTIQK